MLRCPVQLAHGVMAEATKASHLRDELFAGVVLRLVVTNGSWRYSGPLMKTPWCSKWAKQIDTRRPVPL